MALNPLSSHRTIVAFGMVSFFMADHGKTVRVDVGQELLEKIDGRAPRTQRGYVERCERHKHFFAQLAARKYREGKYAPEVNVLVVRINEDDLI